MKVRIIKVDKGVDTYGPNLIAIKHGMNKISQEDYDSIRGYSPFQRKVDRELYHVKAERREGEETEVIPLPGDPVEDKSSDSEKEEEEKPEKKKRSRRRS